LGGEFAHGEVVEDEQRGPGELGQPAGPGAVGVAAGEVGQGAAGFEEANVGAAPDGQVPEGLRHVGFPDADRAVQDDRLAGLQPAQRGQVADLGGGQFRGGVEVELLQRGGLIEAGAAQPALHACSLVG
jgi:hypothetical protein